MEVALEETKKISRSMGHILILAGKCKENSVSIMKKDGICLITDRSIDIFSESKGSLKSTLPWISIRGISIDGTTIKLIFPKKTITIQSELYANEMFGAMCHVLQQLLPTYETKILKLDLYNVPKVKHTGYGCFVRLQEVCRIKEKSIPPQSLEKIQFALMSSQKDIVLSDLGDPFSILPPLLDSLPICTSIQSITIPIIPNEDIFYFLSTAISNVARLHYVDISGNATDSFASFLAKLKNINTSRIQGFTFRNSAFNETHLATLSEFVGQKRISALGFSNAIQNSSLPYFYSNFFDSTMMATLSVINFDGTKNLDVGKLFPLLKHAYILSFEDCNLQIDSIFSQIAVVGLRNLRGINVSKNPCEHFPASAFALPQSLISINANNIHWGEYCLHNILKILFNRTVPSLKLAISHAQCSKDEWNRVFQVFSEALFDGLNSFTWDGNPIHTNLLQFLLNNHSLEYLSISDCLSQISPANINAFSRFLENCESLKFLICRGGQNRYLGRMVGAITRVVAMKKNLIHLDLTDNRLGDQGLSQMKLIFSQRIPLQMIAFDGSMPQTPEALFDVLELASRALDRMRTSFPINDILSLKATGRISNDQFCSIMRKFQKAPKRPNVNSSTNYPIPSNSIFCDPFNIFVNFHSTSMPKYLSPNELNDLKVTPGKPFLTVNAPVKFTSNTIGTKAKKPILAKSLFGSEGRAAGNRAPSVGSGPVNRRIGVPQYDADTGIRNDAAIISDEENPNQMIGRGRRRPQIQKQRIQPRTARPNPVPKAVQPQIQPQPINIPSYDYEYYSDDCAQPQVVTVVPQKQNREPKKNNIEALYPKDAQAMTRNVIDSYEYSEEPVIISPKKQPTQIPEYEYEYYDSISETFKEYESPPPSSKPSRTTTRQSKSDQAQVPARSRQAAVLRAAQRNTKRQRQTKKTQKPRPIPQPKPEPEPEMVEYYSDYDDIPAVVPIRSARSRSEKSRRDDDTRSNRSSRSKKEEEVKSLRTRNRRKSESIRSMRDEDDVRSVRSTKSRQGDDVRSVRSTASRRDEDTRSHRSRRDDDVRSVRSTRSRKDNDDARSVRSTNSRRGNDDSRSVRSTRSRRDDEDVRSTKSRSRRIDESDRRSVGSRSRSTSNRREDDFDDRRSVGSRRDRYEDDRRSRHSQRDDDFSRRSRRADDDFDEHDRRSRSRSVSSKRAGAVRRANKAHRMQRRSDYDDEYDYEYEEEQIPRRNRSRQTSRSRRDSEYSHRRSRRRTRDDYDNYDSPPSPQPPPSGRPRRNHDSLMDDRVTRLVDDILSSDSESFDDTRSVHSLARGRSSRRNYPELPSNEKEGRFGRSRERSRSRDRERERGRDRRFAVVDARRISEQRRNSKRNQYRDDDYYDEEEYYDYE